MGAMASNTSGATGVVAALSRYTFIFKTLHEGNKFKVNLSRRIYS
jgi:hypothetical protein